MTVVNANNQQFGRVEPYLSLTEFKASPTASMLNYSTFVEGGSQQDQDDALYQLILRAGSKVDAHCMGKLGTLNATTNTEVGRYTPNRQGEFVIHPEYDPILSVSAFQWGTTPGMGNVIPLSTSNCFIERSRFIVSQTGAGSSIAYNGINALSSIITGRGMGSQLYCQWSYVNGWANTFSTANVTAGTNTMIVSDPTGIYAGNQLTIWDGSNDEIVTLASNYVAGTSTLTFASNLQYNHVSGTNITALPSTVKQAVIHFVIAMVEERGESGFVIQESGEARLASAGSSHSGHEMTGYDLLDNFQRTWGRT